MRFSVFGFYIKKLTKKKTEKERLSFLNQVFPYTGFKKGVQR